MEKTESLQQQLAQMQAMMVTMQQQMQQASQENIAPANDAASQSSKSDKDRSDSESELLSVPNEEHTAVTLLLPAPIRLRLKRGLDHLYQNHDVSLIAHTINKINAPGT